MTKVTREPKEAAAGFAGTPSGGIQAGQRMPDGLTAQLMGQGMSAPAAQLLAGAVTERDGEVFVLPAKMVPSSLPIEQRAVMIVGLTPDEEARAIDSAGSGMKVASMFARQVAISIWAIGGHGSEGDLHLGRVNDDQRNKWLKAIGPKARKLVDQAFNKLNGIEDGVGEDFLGSSQPGRL
jgi:hypothetical protein